MAKKPVPIDLLLQWAYCDELPKQSIDGLTGWERLTYLGTNVDRGDSGYDVKLPANLGPPHPDALTLDYFVRKLEPVVVNWKRQRKYLMGDLHHYLTEDDPIVVSMSTSPLATLVSDRKAVIDRGPQIVGSRELSPGHLVMMHARMGTRPIWDMGPTRLRAVRGRNGKPMIEGISAGRRYKPGAYCPMQLDPPAQEIACARFEYSIWHQALVTIANESWKLEDHAVQQPTAAAAPWLTGDPIAPRVRSDNVERSTSKLPLKPARLQTLPPLKFELNSSVRQISVTKG